MSVTNIYFNFSDMQKIIDGLGDKMGTCVQLIACFIVAFVQGFVVGWKLALVLLGIVPALVGAALIASKVWTTKCWLHQPV